jgi:hypothetical protein
MPRFTDTDSYLHPDERDAAVAIRTATLAVQRVFDSSYACEYLPDETKEMLLRLYRGLCISTRHYFEDTGIVWTAPPPGRPFKVAQ